MDLRTIRLPIDLVATHPLIDTSEAEHRICDANAFWEQKCAGPRRLCRQNTSSFFHHPALTLFSFESQKSTDIHVMGTQTAINHRPSKSR